MRDLSLLLVVFGALVTTQLVACATRGGVPSEAEIQGLEAALEAPEGPALQVRLAFSSGVDLDLYVSDPRLETVYYANSPSRTGGVLARDARCKDAPAEGVRVEVIRFEVDRPGPYRVGVDYPEGCDTAGDAAFVVRLDVAGATRSVRGLAQPLHFDSRVLEFTLDASGQLAP